MISPRICNILRCTPFPLPRLMVLPVVREKKMVAIEPPPPKIKLFIKLRSRPEAKLPLHLVRVLCSGLKCSILLSKLLEILLPLSLLPLSLLPLSLPCRRWESRHWGDLRRGPERRNWDQTRRKAP